MLPYMHSTSRPFNGTLRGSATDALICSVISRRRSQPSKLIKWKLRKWEVHRVGSWWALTRGELAHGWVSDWGSLRACVIWARV
jgi:hypothetical protein